MRKLVLLIVGLGLVVSALPLAAQPSGVCDPGNGVWTTRAAYPLAAQIRGWGAWFPTNGKFYVLGGRQSDSAGSDIQNIREYDPATNTWATMTATFPSNQVNNMVGGVLDIGGTPHIVVVGGSAAAQTTGTADVRHYDPVADQLTTIATDPWPGNPGGITLPGGAAVYNNRLYIFGGFDINVGMVTSIWEYDPNAAAGTRWTAQAASLPTALGYIPAATVGSFVYLLGGSTYVGGLLSDSNSSLRYDPTLDSITTVATIPRITAETRAVAQTDGTVWVLSGGRTTPPNPTTQVDVYDPVGNSWSLGPPTLTARRNFPADVDPATGDIFTVGGYDANVPVAVHEVLSCVLFVDGFESGNTSNWSVTVP